MSGREGRGSSSRGGRGRGRSGYSGRGRGGGRGRGRGRQQQQNNNHPHSAPTTPTKQRNDTATTNGNPRSRSTQSYGRSQHGNRYNSSGGGGGASNKKDGEIGASAHTVSEEYRIQLTQVLMNLRETDSQDSITMPPDLTNTQRKFVHELSKQLGLKSKSYGKGDERQIKISKISSGSGGSGNGGLGNMMGSIGNNNNQSNTNKKKKKDENALPTVGEYKQVPRINVGKKGEEALRNYLAKFPPSVNEEVCFFI